MTSIKSARNKRAGNVRDRNRAEDPQYIKRLVRQLVTVSVETVRLAASVDLLVVVGVVEAEA